MGNPNPIPKRGHFSYIKKLRRNIRKQEANIHALVSLNESLRLENERLQVERKSLFEALLHYSDPDSYFGIAVFPDRPAGWFANDLDDEHECKEHYDRPMHGSLARKTIREVSTDQERTAQEHYDD